MFFLIIFKLYNLAERFEAIAAMDLSFPSAKSFADPAVSAEIIGLNFLLSIMF